MIEAYEFCLERVNIQHRRSVSLPIVGGHFGSTWGLFFSVRITSRDRTREDSAFHHWGRSVGSVRGDGESSAMELWKIAGSLHRLLLSRGPNSGMVAF